MKATKNQDDVVMTLCQPPPCCHLTRDGKACEDLRRKSQEFVGGFWMQLPPPGHFGSPFRASRWAFWERDGAVTSDVTSATNVKNGECP